MTKPLRVLLVEDSEEDALLLLRQLSKGGYETVHERVETRESLTEALPRGWDIVISDYVMPRFSGLEALRIHRQAGIDIPFIIVSGNIGEDIAVEAMKAGAHDYIVKGNLGRLIPAVDRELRDAAVRREHKRSAAALRESQERLISTLEIITDGFFTLDQEWRFTYVNHAAERLWRRNRETLLGKSIWEEVLFQAANSILFEYFQSAVRDQRAVAFEAHSPLLNLWVDIRAYPAQEGLAVYIRDISERKEADRRSAVHNSLLQLFAQKISKKEYLDAVVQLIVTWSGCKYCGIRLIDDAGRAPYASRVEVREAFPEFEHEISIRDADCVCGRVMAEKPEIEDQKMLTGYGTFYTNDLPAHLSGAPGEKRSRFRGVCATTGVRSLAVIPLRYRSSILGVIHLADQQADRVPLKIVEVLEQISLIIGEALYRFSVEEDLVRQREELVRMNEQLRNLSAHIDAVRESERTNIAREIHDELGQVLTAIKMDLAWIRNRLTASHPNLAEKVAEALQMSDAAIQSVKRICSELRPGILDDIGLAAAIEWAAKDFQKRTGIECAVSFSPENISVDRTRSTALFRIFQEALTNIMRHAEASHVTAALEEKSRTIAFIVRDDGKGITDEEIHAPHAFGLIGMRERVQFLGGTITITGTRGQGTSIEVVLPIDSARSKQN